MSDELLMLILGGIADILRVLVSKISSLRSSSMNTRSLPYMSSTPPESTKSRICIIARAPSRFTPIHQNVDLGQQGRGPPDRSSLNILGSFIMWFPLMAIVAIDATTYITHAVLHTISTLNQ